MTETDKRLISLESLLIRKGIISDDELEEMNDIWKKLESEKEKHS